MRIVLTTLLAAGLIFGPYGCDDPGGSPIPTTDTTGADTTTPQDTQLGDSAQDDTTVIDTSVADTAVADTSIADSAVADSTVADSTVADTSIADTAVADSTVADTTVADTTNPSAVSSQIQAALDAIDAAATLPLTPATTLTITGATVSFVRETIGSDSAGFWIQEDQAGPALFVLHDQNTTAVAAGDRVTFTIDELDKIVGNPAVMVTSALSVEAGTGVDASALAQDVSDIDLITLVDDYQSELLSLTGTIAGDLGGAGDGFKAVEITTAGVPTADTHFELRLPTTLATALMPVEGCTFTVTAAPLWRYTNSSGTFTRVEPSPYTASELSVTCAAPQLVSALTLTDTTIKLTFDRAIAADSLTDAASQITFDNSLTATSASVGGASITVTVDTPFTSGTTYTVTVAATITDTGGRGIDAAHNSATFDFAIPDRQPLFISEYVEGSSYNKAIEIFNFSAMDTNLTAHDCELRFYGSPGDTHTDISNAIALTGMIAAGGTYVICDDSASAPVLDVCDLEDGGSFYNGDDPIELNCDGLSLDWIGQTGVDITYAKDKTLRRGCDIGLGDFSGDDLFDVDTEWVTFPKDAFDGLGHHAPRATPANIEGAKELVIEALDIDAQQVVLRNVVDSDVTITTDWRLCNFPNYEAFVTGDTVIGAGQSATFDIPAAVGISDAAAFELGVYKSSDFTNDADIVAYVEVMGAGKQREPVAITAGVWTMGNFVPFDAATDGGIIAISGAMIDGAADYRAFDQNCTAN